MRHFALALILVVAPLCELKAGIPGIGGPGLVHAQAGGGTWSLVQHKVLNSSSCDTNAACSMTVTSTGTGHALFLMGALYDSVTITITYSSASGGCTWAHNSATDGSRNYSIGNILSNVIAYCTASTSGTTTVTLTGSTGLPTLVWSMEFVEFAWSGSTIAYDTGGTTSVSADCTSCTGQALTLSGSSDLICQMFNTSSSNPSAITGGAGYTAFTLEVDANYGSVGYACAINTTTGTAPTWTITSGQGQVSAIALKGS